MTELLTLLAIYYKCTALAEAGLLPQSQRFECNRTYQAAKLHFADPSDLAAGQPLTSDQNTRAYLRFKAWEEDNADLVATLRTQ